MTTSDDVAPSHTTDPVPPPAPTLAPLDRAWSLLWQAHAPIPYQPTWGIPSYWRDHFSELGSPLAIEFDEGNGQTLQVFARGIVRWRPDSGAERVA